MSAYHALEQVLVISPETEHRERISEALHRCGLTSISCKRFDEARNFLARQKFEVVLCQDTLPDGDFRDVVAAVNPTPVVVLSRFAEWDHYLAALRDGAFEYISCPPDTRKQSALCGWPSATVALRPTVEVQ
jgi:DNA-binding NtrC family response regulator